MFSDKMYICTFCLVKLGVLKLYISKRIIRTNKEEFMLTIVKGQRVIVAKMCAAERLYFSWNHGCSLRRSTENRLVDSMVSMYPRALLPLSESFIERTFVCISFSTLGLFLVQSKGNLPVSKWYKVAPADQTKKINYFGKCKLLFYLPSAAIGSKISLAALPYDSGAR